MISDYQILGIAPDSDLAGIKAAFRTKAKEIHPDINDSSFDSHLRFIVLQQAYHRLLSGAAGSAEPAPRQAPAPRREPAPRQAPGSGSIQASRDPAYAFYRAGMNEYMKVHPSVWSNTTKIIVVARGQEDLDTLAETRLKVRQLTRAFPKAYYYFSVVVNDWPDSVWAPDARDKLRLIEQQTIRYRSIIESFLTHARPAPRVNR